MKTKLKLLLMYLILPVYFIYQMIKNGIPYYKYWYELGFISLAWECTKSKLHHKLGLSKKYTLEELLIELNK